MGVPSFPASWPEPRVPYEALWDLATAILEAVGVPTEGARQTAEVLATADLRGIHSHGVYRLPFYVEALERGLVEPDPDIRVERETPTSALIHGGNGLGPVVGIRAMEVCLEKARASGMAAVGVHHSNHYGIAGYYAMMALRYDMIGLSMTNAAANVAPTGAARKALGTNPIAVAVPAGEERPFVLDMATSVVAQGKIATRVKQGLEIPLGWGLDRFGQPTTDGRAILEEGGSILPLGGLAETAGYKGYGLATLVDILCGPLTGALFGVSIPKWLAPGRTGPHNIGHFFAAMRVDLFRPVDEFKAEMDRLIRQLRGLPRARGVDRIYVAGEKELEAEEENRRLGIPLPRPHREALQALAARLGLGDRAAFLARP
jgi:LDH2 family malate/lactate/ureidoglycolate dehydrogenase